MLTKTHVRGIASLLLAAALAVVPASGVGAAPSTNTPKAANSYACAALTNDLTSGLAGVTAALNGPIPNLTRATGLVGTLTNTVESLISLGCLPDPAWAFPTAQLEANPAVGKAHPGPCSSAACPPPPWLPPQWPPVVTPGCAALAADLLSELFGLLSSLLQTLGGAPLDLPALLGQVAAAQSTVAALTTVQNGGTPCLPDSFPVSQ